MWRPAIEDHDQNDHHGQEKSSLVTALREALRRYVGHLVTSEGSDLEAVLDDLLCSDRNYSVFSRLRLNVYRDYAAAFRAAIEKCILADFRSTTCWHEYYYLVREQFPHLSQNTRNQWFNLLDQGPEGDHDDDYVQHWKARKLSAVIDTLTPEQRTKYQRLLPMARAIEYPDFLAYTGSGWVGPTSPLTKEDLTTMSVNAIVDHLASWTPSKEWFSPSREGLGRELSEIVKERAVEFSTEAPRFANSKIAPVYVYHLLLGLREPLKNNIQLDWRNIISLALTILVQAESGTLPVFTPDNDIDAWEVEWSATFQEIATLLEAGMQHTSAGLPFEERKNIWRLLEYLCEHPDPTPEYEQKYGGDNMEPFTLSINTVRGHAFHALFSYIFWCDRNLGGKGECGSRIPSECKTVLEAHLRTDHHTLCVRALLSVAVCLRSCLDYRNMRTPVSSQRYPTAICRMGDVSGERSVSRSVRISQTSI